MDNEIVMSTLPKTWIFDLDGTIVKHNGYLLDGEDTLLPGVREYLSEIPISDRVLIFTSRTEEYRERTVCFLDTYGIRYDGILFNMPVGERIVVNDRKPSGLDMAVAMNVNRDTFALPQVLRQL